MIRARRMLLGGDSQWALVATLLLAFALRVWGLDDRNIWWDEGLATWAARLPVAAILNWTAHDVHPPLYFLLQRAWWLLVGDGEFVLRYTSVLAGTAGVALVYQLARTLAGQRAGLLTALLLALSPFAVSWSQEMRMYIAAAGAATLALWAAARWWQCQHTRYLLVYVVAAAMGLWLLYLSVSVLIIANLAFLSLWIGRRLRRPAVLRWIVAQVAAVALFAPWLAYALPRIPTWSTAEPFTLGVFVQLYATTLALGVSENLDRFLIPTLLVMAVALLALWWAWRTAHSPARRAALLMLLWGVALPALLVYLVSLPVHIFYAPRLAPRYLLPLAVCFYTLLGWGIAALGQRYARLAAAAALLVVSVSVFGLTLFYPGRIRRDDLLSLTHTVEALRQPADTVLLYSDRDWPLFAAQYADAWRGVPNGADMQADAAGWLLEPIWQGADGVWLATTPDALRMDAQGFVPAWLAAHAVAVTHWDFGDHALDFYARTPARAAHPYAVVDGYQPQHGAAQTGGGPLAAAYLPLRRYAVGDTLRLALLWRTPAAAEIQLSGPVERRVVAPAPASAQGTSYSGVAVPLSADLPAGHYRVTVQTEGQAALSAGEFTLVSLAPAGAAALPLTATPLDVRLGETIHLLGYQRAAGALHPGDVLDLTLYWRTDVPLEERYKVFTHLLGDVWNAANSNFIWGQLDSEPAGGTALTTTWTPGAIITDRYRILIPMDAPPGDYRLEVGMYRIVGGERLPVASGGDAVLLGVLRVGGRDE